MCVWGGGRYQGQKVQDVKKAIQKLMISKVCVRGVWGGWKGGRGFRGGSGGGGGDVLWW